MFKPQPEEYYQELAEGLFKIYGIPQVEIPSLFNASCVQEKEIRRLRYTKKGKVVYQKYAVFKYKEQKKEAKALMIYYLWDNKIKVPFGKNTCNSTSINEVRFKIADDEVTRTRYAKFKEFADSIPQYQVYKRVIKETYFEL